MMKIYLITFSLLIVSSSHATNYYLSNTGNDANSGTSAFDPWQSISKLNTVTLQPGDSVFFESGSIFRGQINMLSGGTGVAPIYFGKYGSGDLPVISGAEAVNGWTNYSGNIYLASFAQSPSQLFADNKRMTIARYPNSGYLIHQDGIGGNLGFIDTLLTQSNGFWNGANVRMRANDRVWEANSVFSFSNDTILFQSPSFNSVPGGYGYYFDNLFSLVDTSAEWFYDNSSQSLYLIAPGNVDPSLLKTEASIYDFGMSIQNGSSNITIENIQFEKQNKSGVNVDTLSFNLVFSKCNFLNEGESGIECDNGGSNITINGCKLEQCLAGGFRGANLDHCIISENTFRAIGLLAGFVFSNETNGFAISYSTSGNVVVSGNVIDSSGNGGIKFESTSDTIEKNIFTHNFLTVNNNGVIAEVSPFNKNNVVRDNFFLNTEGNIAATPGNAPYTAGIWASDSCANCIIDHNTIVETSGTGILFSPGSTGYSLHRNLIYGCGESQVKFIDGISLNATHNNQATGNVFYAIHENQDIIRLESHFEAFMPALFDSNYYFNPYDFFAYHKLILFDPDPTNFRNTLHQWQGETGDDLNSKPTYFWRNRYSLIDSLGPDVIANGQFTNNFDGWSIAVSGNANMLLDNSTPLDFGCLKIWKEDTIPFHEGGVVSKGFSIDSGLYYAVKINNYSIREGNVRPYLSTSDPPFNGIGFSRYFPFFNYPQSYETIFQAPQSNAHAQLEILITYKDSIVWIDNVSISPVIALYHDPKKLSRLFYNSTNLPVSYNLGDSMFFDLDSNVVSNQLILAPYSSTVLIYDSSLILNLDPLIANKFIKLFPNPAVRGSRIFVQSFEALSETVHFRLIDMVGNVWIDNKIQNMPSTFELPIPFNMPVGIYLLQLRSDKHEYSAKFLIE